MQVRVLPGPQQAKSLVRAGFRVEETRLDQRADWPPVRWEPADEPRNDTGGGPLETFALWAFLTAVLVIGMAWRVGVLVSSILRASLPADGDSGAAIPRTFPDIGRAWTPPIPSPLVWSALVVVIVVMAPIRAGIGR